MRALFLLIAASVALLCGAVQAVGNDFFVNRTNYCFASTQPAQKPFPLEFCYWLNDNSCCVPGTDLVAENAFYGMVSTGAGCSPSDHKVRAINNEMRDFLCMPCDPNEPSYRFLTAVGDMAAGGVNGPSASAAPDDFTWRICASFLYGKDDKSGLWGGDGSKFDQCGVLLQTGNATSAQMIFPRAEYGDVADNQHQAAQNFLSVLPMWLPGFSFVITDDITNTSFNYTATPCFRGTNSASSKAIAMAVFVGLATLFAAW